MGGIGSGTTPDHTIEDAWQLIRLMRDDGLPLVRAAARASIAYSTAHDLIQRHDATREAYEAAQALVADHMANLALAAVEDGVRLVLDESVDAKRANAVASATRNLSDRRAWAARMLNPDRYGDSVRHSGTLEHRHAVVMLPPLATLQTPTLQQLTPLSETSVSGTLPTIRATLAAGDGASGDDARAHARSVDNAASDGSVST